jgi:hypothetical protein
MGIPKAEDMRYHLPTGEYILIPFTRDEWLETLDNLRAASMIWESPTTLNIIDRIEKNLGIE